MFRGLIWDLNLPTVHNLHSPVSLSFSFTNINRHQTTITTNPSHSSTCLLLSQSSSLPFIHFLLCPFLYPLRLPSRSFLIFSLLSFQSNINLSPLHPVARSNPQPQVNFSHWTQVKMLLASFNFVWFPKSWVERVVLVHNFELLVVEWVLKRLLSRWPHPWIIINF